MVDLFGGHVFPGCGFTVLGLWWSLTTAIRLVRAENLAVRKGYPNTYRSTTSMPILCLPCSILRHPSVETILKLIASFVGILWHSTEIHTEHSNQMSMQMDESTLDRSHILTHRTKQHVAIYLGFFLGAICELLIHMGVRFPQKLDRALLILQFGVEWLVFSNHSHGRGHIDNQLHVIHAFTILGIVFFCVMEAYDERQVLFTYGRVVFTILQGTWFWQIALTLYHPQLKWNLEDDELLPNVAFVYCIHFYLVLIFLFVEWAIVKVVIGQASWFKKASSPGGQRRPLRKVVVDSVSDEEDCILYQNSILED